MDGITGHESNASSGDRWLQSPDEFHVPCKSRVALSFYLGAVRKNEVSWSCGMGKGLALSDFEALSALVGQSAVLQRSGPVYQLVQGYSGNFNICLPR